MARCTGSSGGFAYYRRDPLLGTCREGGGGDHVRAVELEQKPWKLSKPTCYNFLYEIKIPDSTPEIISRYALSDEQALLARIRYNRLLDIFLGITCYSLQNHLRTNIESWGQIEVDELYVGVNATGATFVMPVEAKAGSERISIVQAFQGFELARLRYPELVARPVAATFVDGQDTIALFEFAPGRPIPTVRNERHYRLVPASEITADDLRTYREASGK
jgi:hypothetical protein